MDITLDSTDKIFSIGLAVVTASTLVLRKVISPVFKYIYKYIRNWFSTLERLNRIESILENSSINVLAEQNAVHHKLSHTNNFKLKILLDNLPIPLFECAPDGECVWTNKAIQGLFKASPEGMLGAKWLEYLHPDDIGPTHAKWGSALSSGAPYKARYRVLDSQTGEITYCEAFADPIRDEKDEILSMLGTLRIIKKENFHD